MTCAKCRDGIEHEWRHGTRTSYVHHHCRCAECEAAQRAYYIANRERILGAANARYQKNRSTRADLAELERRAENRREWKERYPDPLDRRRARQREWSRTPQGRECRRGRVPRDRTEYHQEYYRDRWRNATQEHRDYNNASTTATLRRKQEATSTPTVRRGKWLASEDAVLRRKDITVLEMAFMTGRAYHSVTARRKRLRQQGLL